jgi:hypothetical protein
MVWNDKEVQIPHYYVTVKPHHYKGKYFTSFSDEELMINDSKGAGTFKVKVGISKKFSSHGRHIGTKFGNIYLFFNR